MGFPLFYTSWLHKLWYVINKTKSPSRTHLCTLRDLIHFFQWYSRWCFKAIVCLDGNVQAFLSHATVRRWGNIAKILLREGNSKIRAELIKRQRAYCAWIKWTIFRSNNEKTNLFFKCLKMFLKKLVSLKCKEKTQIKIDCAFTK